VFFGVKEVPIDALIPDKKYFSFHIPLKNSPTTASSCRLFWKRILICMTTKP